MGDETAVPTGIRRGAYLPELESLRGIAILLVYAFHADGILGFPLRSRAGTWPSLPVALVWGGHTGVSLFFVLSAFLLTLPFLAEANGGRPVSRRDFYVRRALRILPLFYAAVLVATLATCHRLADLRHALPYLTFTFFWPGSAVPMQPYGAAWWSLAVEVQFYAALPLLAFAFGRSRALTLALLIGFVACWTATWVGWRAEGLNPALFSFSLLGRAPLFLSGILAAWVYHRHGEALRVRLASRRWLRGGGGDLLLVATIASLAAFLRWRLLWFTWVQRYEAPLLVPEGVLWAAVVLCVLLLPLATRGLFSNRLLQWLGVLSYSIYLVHFPVLQFGLGLARRLFPGAVGIAWTPAAATWVTAATVACLAISSLSYRFIEQPFLARKTRFVTPGAREARPA